MYIFSAKTLKNIHNDSYRPVYRCYFFKSLACKVSNNRFFKIWFATFYQHLK